MSYAPDHASALLDLTRAGAAVTFTLTRPGTFSPSTDTWSTPTETTVTGAAVRVKGSPLTYQRLNLAPSEAPTLLFTPTTYGDVPALGSAVVWGSVTYVVKDVEPLAPDGTAILSRVVVAR